MGKLLLASAALFALVANVHCIWPNPRSITLGGSIVTVPFPQIIPPPGASLDLLAAIEKAESQILEDDMFPLVVPSLRPNASSLLGAKVLTGLQMTLVSGSASNSIAYEARLPLEQRNEYYTLYIPDGGLATLKANTSLGLFRGLTTFTQSVYATSTGSKYIENAPITIEDGPAYVR